MAIGADFKNFTLFDLFYCFFIAQYIFFVYIFTFLSAFFFKLNYHLFLVFLLK